MNFTFPTFSSNAVSADSKKIVYSCFSSALSMPTTGLLKNIFSKVVCGIHCCHGVAWSNAFEKEVSKERFRYEGHGSNKLCWTKPVKSSKPLSQRCEI